MMVHVLQGERELVDDCRSLAKFTLTGIPPMTAGGHIRVTFQVDADGLLNVTAQEKAQVCKRRSSETFIWLAEEQIAQMLKASMANAKDDMQQRMLKEQQVEAARVLEALEAALVEHRGLLSEEEFAQLRQSMDTLAHVAQSKVLTRSKNTLK